VLEKACADLDQWHQMGHRRVRMAVNVSARQLERQEFVVKVEELLQRYGLPPGSLELELTETGIMSGSERGSETLRALEALGVSLAVDDFGTGYSSLAYLKRLSVDRLKIDRSFIQDIPLHADDAEIAATIIAMARQLKLSVVAEGVENEAQEAFLRQQGCELVQGFYYSSALSAVSLLELLADSSAPDLPAER
jgi:EAL domain-containing protein (putative c-di-GMP-specific phosphodiesterase class I)